MNKSLNVAGQLLDLSTPQIMGVINVTPDSFYEGSRATDLEFALREAKKMISEGASILDVGGYSSRPKAEDISEQAEIDRVVPVIEALAKEFETSISIDTFRSKVAEEAIKVGASIINDISGGDYDDEMLPLAARTKCVYIGMHMRGNPQNMQSRTKYDDVVRDVFARLGEIKKNALNSGIKDVVLDPGFGFAKTIEQNYYLLKNLSYFKQLDCPILVGVSRKSMIYRLLDVEPTEALNGTTALNTIALLNGADILRVHDVKEAKEVITLVKALNDSSF